MSALGLGEDNRTRRDQDRFLAAFSGSGSVTSASRSAKIRRGQHYVWIDNDPSYPARWKAAVRAATRTLEDEAVRRAREGVRRPVLYKGKPVFVEGLPLYESDYSDQLLMFLLKAYDPDRFKDRSETTVRMPQSIEDLPEELLDAFIARFEQIAADRKRKLAAAEPAQLEAGAQPASEQTVDVQASEPSAESTE